MIIEQLWEEAQSNAGVKMDKDDKIEGYVSSLLLLKFEVDTNGPSESGCSFGQSNHGHGRIFYMKSKQISTSYMASRTSLQRSYAFMYGGSWKVTASPVQKKIVRFSAPEIVTIIYDKYFAGPRMLGAWVEGEFNEPPDFNYANSFIEKIAAVRKPRAIERGLPYAVSDEHQKAYAQRLADVRRKLLKG
ncbi:hypothetical protein BDZ91DRAFT_763853 [Kalaharituber pfeilii]|nr:hypothetical protein BDZ91DRAFT_763853 [Kalaharituber pfeilii]